ncbi:MAG: hypothetical protein ABIR26_12225 [Ramlibacter sp.]
MIKALCVALLVTLAGCAGTVPIQEQASSACWNNEASYACQVERYNNVNVP